MYDVIIAGAGPAGLTAAAELSKNKDLRLLLIEKEKFPKPKATWQAFESHIKEKGFEKAYSRVLDKISANIMGIGELVVNRPFVILDQIKFLKLLKSRVRKNCEFIDNCSFDNFKVNKDLVSVNTPKGEFKSKLLIDCTSTGSPVAKKYGLHKDIFVWQCMIYDVDDSSTSGFKEIIWDLPYERDDKVNFWMDIRGKRKLSVGVMFLTKIDKVMDKSKLKKYLDEYLIYKKINGKIKDIKCDLICLSNFKRMSFDNILLAGNAAAQGVPDTGFGFFSALDGSEMAAIVAKKALEKGDFSSKMLREYDKLFYEKYEKVFRFNSILQIFHYKSNYEDLVGVLDILGKEWLVKKTALELSDEEMGDFFRKAKLKPKYLFRLPWLGLIRHYLNFRRLK